MAHYTADFFTLRTGYKHKSSCLFFPAEILPASTEDEENDPSGYRCFTTRKENGTVDRVLLGETTFLGQRGVMLLKHPHKCNELHMCLVGTRYEDLYNTDPVELISCPKFVDPASTDRVGLVYDKDDPSAVAAATIFVCNCVERDIAVYLIEDTDSMDVFDRHGIKDVMCLGGPRDNEWLGVWHDCRRRLSPSMYSDWGKWVRYLPGASPLSATVRTARDDMDVIIGTPHFLLLDLEIALSGAMEKVIAEFRLDGAGHLDPLLYPNPFLYSMPSLLRQMSPKSKFIH